MVVFRGEDWAQDLSQNDSQANTMIDEILRAHEESVRGATIEPAPARPALNSVPSSGFGDHGTVWKDSDGIRIGPGARERIN